MRHRINSASSAPLSVRSAGSRLSSRTLPTRNKQKPITGRPSSAPVSILKQTKKRNSKENESEKHCELQVIGKAIQSSLHGYQRTTIRNRAALRVLSSRRQFVPLSQREDVSEFLENAKRYTNISPNRLSDASSESEIHSTPSIMSCDHRLKHTRSHSNTKSNIMKQDSVNVYTKRVPKFIQQPSAVTNRRFSKFSSAALENSPAIVDNETDSSNFYYTSDDTECADARRRDITSPIYHIKSSESFCEGTQPQTSNEEESDGTTTSLGQQIQILARQNSTEMPSYQQNSNLEPESPKYWDQEWQQLIQNNHNLILKINDAEIVQQPIVLTSNTMKESPISPQRSLDDTHRSLLHDAKSTVNSERTPDNDKEIQSLKKAMEILSTVVDDKILQPIDECGESSLSSSSNSRKSQNHSSPETTLQDVPFEHKLTETTVSEKENENTVPTEAWTVSIENPPKNVTIKISQDNETKLVDIEDETNALHEPVIDKSSPIKYQTSFPILDQLCSKNLSARTWTKSDDVDTSESFRPSRQVNSYRKRQGPSESLLNAIKMLDTENNKVRSTDNSEQEDCTDSVGMDKEKEPKSTRLLLLSQKIKLFSEDIHKIWKEMKVSSKPYADLEHKWDAWLEDSFRAEQVLEEICITEKIKEDPRSGIFLHQECQEKQAQKQKEFDNRIQKNVELIRKLLDDKKLLAEKCEKSLSDQTLLERKHTSKLKQIQDRHNQEMEDMKEKLKVDDQIKREKWSQQRTKLIKDSTYRSLETKIKDMTAKHRDDEAKLREQHWQQVRQQEEQSTKKLRDLEENLRTKFEKEKNEAVSREKDRERERYEHELKQSDLVWEGRLEAANKQSLRSRTEAEEEFIRTKSRMKSDHEDQMRTMRREIENNKADHEEQLRTLTRTYEKEMCNTKQLHEKSQMEWRESLVRDLEKTKQRSERELRERLRRQRDKEIEKSVREIQQEMSTRILDQQKTTDTKIKNIRERYETEMTELENCERTARTRYLEAKAILAQKEEEIVYMRARLHTQNLELSDLQQMVQGSDS